MRALLPEPISALDDERLAALYAWPAPPRGRPWVRTNFAHTVDCSFADADGLSAGVSNASDKAVFVLLRATCDAVLVGAGTARAENYKAISVRDSLAPLRRNEGRDKEPRLIVVTRSGNVSGELREAATVLQVGSQEELADALTELRSEGVERLLCEGGPHLFTDLVAADLVDDLCMTTTPTLLGTSKMSLLTRALPSKQELGLTALIEDSGTLMARWTIQRER